MTTVRRLRICSRPRTGSSAWCYCCEIRSDTWHTIAWAAHGSTDLVHVWHPLEAKDAVARNLKKLVTLAVLHLSAIVGRVVKLDDGQHVGADLNLTHPAD